MTAVSRTGSGGAGGRTAVGSGVEGVGAPGSAAEGQGGPVTVDFLPSGRPEAATVVSLESFDGPLALLLALIEQRQLDVLSVPLGDLAGAYLEALVRLTGDRLRHISAFVTVAAQLILIKSRALLPAPSPPPKPSPEEELGDPETELRQRLILYRAYREAGRHLGERLLTAEGLFHREATAAVAAGIAGAQPPREPPLDPGVLPAALGRLVRLVPPPEPPPEVVPRTVTLVERAAVIREALRQAPVVVLQDLLAGIEDRAVVAVTFLAMLELVKAREVLVEQSERFGAITCRAVR